MFSGLVCAQRTSLYSPFSSACIDWPNPSIEISYAEPHRFESSSTAKERAGLETGVLQAGVRAAGGRGVDTHRTSSRGHC